MDDFYFLIWIVVGLGLLFVEQAIPAGFFFFFFGAAAILTGILTAFGLLPDLTTQLIALIVFSVVPYIFFRKKVIALFIKDTAPAQDDTDSLVGVLGTTSSAIAAGERGKVELRGSTWTARNTGSVDLASGDSVRVVSVDGLVLNVTKE